MYINENSNKGNYMYSSVSTNILSTTWCLNRNVHLILENKHILNNAITNYVYEHKKFCYIGDSK